MSAAISVFIPGAGQAPARNVGCFLLPGPTGQLGTHRLAAPLAAGRCHSIRGERRAQPLGQRNPDRRPWLTSVRHVAAPKAIVAAVVAPGDGIVIASGPGELCHA